MRNLLIQNCYRYRYHYRYSFIVVNVIVSFHLIFPFSWLLSLSIIILPLHFISLLSFIHLLFIVVFTTYIYGSYCCCCCYFHSFICFCFILFYFWSIQLKVHLFSDGITKLDSNLTLVQKIYRYDMHVYIYIYLALLIEFATFVRGRCDSFSLSFFP